MKKDEFDIYQSDEFFDDECSCLTRIVKGVLDESIEKRLEYNQSENLEQNNDDSKSFSLLRLIKSLYLHKK